MLIFETFVVLCLWIFAVPKCMIFALSASTSDPYKIDNWTKNEMRQLPPKGIGWKFIREDDKYLYVDKTRFVEFLGENPLNILTRPRRFGKTTFLQMVYHLYRNDHEMFQGLYVQDIGNVKWIRHRILSSNKYKYATWATFPVIHLNFGDILQFRTYEDYTKYVEESIAAVAKQYGIQDSILSFRITHLINDLHEKFNLPVILLIDEYDSAYNRAIFRLQDHDLADKVLGFCEGFYGAIKQAEPALAFALVTGVSTLLMDAIDTGPNNFEDITYSKEMAHAFGFTRHEIETNLCFHVYNYTKFRVNKELKSKGIKIPPREPKHNEINATYNELDRWYDGYQFDKYCESETVLNVVSTITALREKDITEHWPKTGSITLVIKQFHQSQESLQYYKNDQRIDRKSLEKHANPVSYSLPMNMFFLIYGFMTLDKFDETKKGNEISLKFPNEEILRTFEDRLVHYYPEKDYFFDRFRNEKRTFRDCFNLMAHLESCIQQLDNFKIYAYNYSNADDNSFNTKEVPKKLKAIFKHNNVESETDLTFFKEGSSDPAGDVDLLTSNLRINVAAEVKCTKNEKTSVAAIMQLIGYYENHHQPFMEVLGHPKKINFLGLHYRIDEKSKELKLEGWIRIPYADGHMLINNKEMEFSSKKVKYDFWQAYRPKSSSQNVAGTTSMATVRIETTTIIETNTIEETRRPDTRITCTPVSAGSRQDQQVSNNMRARHLTQADVQLFIRDGLVPEYLSGPPVELLQVAYPSNIPVHLGRAATYDQILQKPKLQWNCGPDKTYTIIVIHAVQYIVHPSKSVHFEIDVAWFIVNIPGCEIDKGSVIFPYDAFEPSCQGFGVKLFLYMIFDQRKGNISVPRFMHRQHHDAKEFTRQFGFEDPFAANFLYVPC